jgi:hypothetical protein
MTTREELRRDGIELRRRLFGPGASEHFVPNYAAVSNGHTLSKNTLANIA